MVNSDLEKFAKRKETIGDAVLYLADTLDILEHLPACDALVTDPPYSSGGYNEAGKSEGSIGTTSELRKIEGDTLSTRGYFNLIRRTLRRSRTASSYVFTDWRMWPYTVDATELAGYRVRGMIVWDKGYASMGTRWKSQHELICWGTKVVSKMGAGMGNVISAPRTGNKNHPTEKPVGLLRALVGNAEGETVVDPFMGSGTTGVACREIGKRFVGIELDPAHFETALERIQSAQAGMFTTPEPPKPLDQRDLL